MKQSTSARHTVHNIPFGEPAKVVMLPVKLFAQARTLAGMPQVDVPWADGLNVAQLKRALGERYQALQPLIPRLLVAVNNEYAQDDAIIRASDEVACFPPVSGG